MEIIDIQEVKVDTKITYEVTFSDSEGYDVAKIHLSKDDMWQIAHYCRDNLSYGAQRRVLMAPLPPLPTSLHPPA